jgi:hypothetical protein
MSKTRYWIGVVSRNHVENGVACGIAQVCGGKAYPLKRMKPGDWLIYYSPRTDREGGEAVQAFTAIGRVAGDEVYQFAMSETFVPFRRDINYLPYEEAEIKPLLAQLSFIKDKQRWGFPFHRGHFEINAEDFAVIATAMGIRPEAQQEETDAQELAFAV